MHVRTANTGPGRRTDLDGVQRATCTFRVELNTPYFFAGLRGRLDTLHGRVIAVNEEGFPSSWERILKLERVLVILAVMIPRQSVFLPNWGVN